MSKSIVSNFFKHIKLVSKHKWLVFKFSLRLGIPFRGLVHDLSKFSYDEFWESVKYYDGKISPITRCKQANGYSKAWLHHKGRNKHHMEYWIDYSVDKEKGICGMEMPVKYVVEMYIDRVSAAKNYQKGAYTDRSPLEYYENGKSIHILHPNTRELLERLLTMLAEEGEKATYEYIRREVLKNKK